MRRLPIAIALIATVVVALPLTAQGSAGGGSVRGGGEARAPGARGGAAVEAMRERRGPGPRGEALAGDDRRARMDQRRERLAAMAPEDRAALAERLRGGRPDGVRGPRSPEQAAFAQSLREKRRELRGAVSAGTLDRHAAAEQLRSWLRSNRPGGPASP